MRVIELGVLAQLAVSVSSLAVLGGDEVRNHLVKARTGTAASSSAPSAPTGDSWKTIKCSEVQGDAQSQWKEAGALSAWNTTIAAWEQNPSGGFPQYVSSYLHGPGGMRCGDIGSENRCSLPVDCQDATIPGGALILNGFAGIHELHASAFQAIGGIQADVTDQIGTFTSTFAPQPPNTGLLQKNIFDAAALIFSFGTSMLFNVALKQMENVIAKAIMADMTGAVFGTATSYYKTNMKGAIEGLQVQNTLASFLGETMSAWKGIESGYLEAIFSGNAGSNGTDALYAMINNGAMGEVMNNINLNGTSKDVQKILYGQMIPYAWSVSPDHARPFIWQSEDECDGTTKSIPEDAANFVSNDDAVKTNVCYNGKIHYVLNGHSIAGTGFPASALPGGDHNTLDGTNWGGIILEDIVESCVSGWTNNNYQNGYPRPDSNSIVNSFSGDVPSVRTPGFMSLPVCTNATAIINTMQQGNGNSPYWPCEDPEGYTSSGTNIHVSSGCIVINDSKRCQTWGGAYNVADQNTADSTATIYAKFDGDNTLNAKVTPGCKLMASWPRDYGDLDFTDNCLKDRSGDYSQCCTDDTTTTDVVNNPYAP
ncbi:hypothetical protein N7537_003539 [Penicillium hordei]|uniref:Uncharacterized protein n=1 Tax=Penicillium hordei TaxID=40994 RepID=A0AAD6E9H7_9EURO|nr:uncharacterized protein N7537_003539 [Penicillium hordei]KAJ5606920.1 hypothetical protein N7537_003539 [Penicillium hordei]